MAYWNWSAELSFCRGGCCVAFSSLAAKATKTRDPGTHPSHNEQRLGTPVLSDLGRMRPSESHAFLGLHWNAWCVRAVTYWFAQGWWGGVAFAYG